MKNIYQLSFYIIMISLLMSCAGDGVRVSTNSMMNPEDALIKGKGFSGSEEKCKKIIECIKCTRGLQKKYNLGENCEGAEEKLDTKVCRNKSISNCSSPSGCVCSFGGTDACCSDFTCMY